jgi:predicted nucleotidyltransferase
MSLFELGAIIAELNELLGIRVDVATPSSVSDTMRQRVPREAVPL